MPKRTDIATVLILGSGPIVIGQACECYRVVLVNSNPATIMTDPGIADRTYVEPLTPGTVAQIIERERHHVPGGFAVLPTLGGQTGLNVAVALAEQGVLERFDVEMIGAGLESIRLAEDRKQFAAAMREIGLDTAASVKASSLAEAQPFADEHGFPLLVRASFTLGGAGSGMAHDAAEFAALVAEGVEASPIGEVQIDESLLGWKEYELEVMRDGDDNCVVICSIENVDAMGVHTGDSVTVAPAMTLSDVEYQAMRDAAFAVLRRVGVETGGSNVQFAVNPLTGDLRLVEMNPRGSTPPCSARPSVPVLATTPSGPCWAPTATPCGNAGTSWGSGPSTRPWI